MKRFLLLAGLFAAIFGFYEPARAAPTATFIVDSTADKPDKQPGDSKCEAKDGTCTLRAAIMEANALPGKDKVQLWSTTYPLTRVGSDDDALRGDLDITSDLTLSGPLFGNAILDMAE